MSNVSPLVPRKNPPPEQQVTVDGEDVHHVEAGRGPVFLSLHGHEQDATTWPRVMPALAEDRRVIAVTLPGHDRTRVLADGYAATRDLARSVGDSLGVGDVDLVGHSMGRAVALPLALFEPSRVRTLTLVAAAGIGREVNPLIALGTLPGVGEGPSSSAGCPVGTCSARCSRWRCSSAGRGARPWASAARRTPWVAGPAHHARAATARLPRARLALFPACGHLPHVEQPDRFIAELRTLLTQPQHWRHDAA